MWGVRWREGFKQRLRCGLNGGAALQDGAIGGGVNKDLQTQMSQMAAGGTCMEKISGERGAVTNAS